MASKTIDHLTMEVGVTPYKHEGNEYDALIIIVSYKKGRGFCVMWQPVKLMPHGYQTGPMSSSDPLVGGKGFVVKEATKNSAKTLQQMKANLEVAEEGIKFYFDQRNYEALKKFMVDVCNYGYPSDVEQRLRETIARHNAMREDYHEKSHKEELSPMMKWFYDIKAKYPESLLLLRCGDFYETYEDDAKECAKILGITLTSQENGTRMAGFPHHALDSYLPRLVRAGKRIAICDQLEDPRQTKKLVYRGSTGPMFRPATMAEIEGRDVDLYMNGEQVWVMMIHHSETIGEGEPKLDYIMLTNMKKVQVEDLQVIDNNSNNTQKEDEVMTLNKKTIENVNVQNAQVNNHADEPVDVNVGEVTVDSIQPAMQPVEGTEYKVKSDGKTATFSSMAPNIGSEEKPKVTLKKKTKQTEPDHEAVGELAGMLTKVRLVTYITKRGETAPRIVGFSGEDDPRWKPIYDEKQALVAAYNKAKKKDPKTKITSSPFGPAWLADREGGSDEKTYCMTFGVKYMECAKALCEAYNTTDRELWKQAEQAVRDCKAGIAANYQAERAAKRAEREAKKNLTTSPSPNGEGSKVPAMSAEEQAMYDLFKKFMSGDKEAMTKVGAMLNAA